MELIESSDETVRAAKLKFPNHKILTRPIYHLYPLELSNTTMNSICWPECHELTWCYSYLCLLRYDTCTFMNCAHDRNSCTDPWSMHTWHDHTQFTCPCTRTVHTTFQSFQKKAAPYGWIVDPKELGVYHFGILYYWTPESRHWPSQQHLVSWGLLFPKWGASSYTCYWCTVCKSRGERGGIDFFI